MARPASDRSRSRQVNQCLSWRSDLIQGGLRIQARPTHNSRLCIVSGLQVDQVGQIPPHLIARRRQLHGIRCTRPVKSDAIASRPVSGGPQVTPCELVPRAERRAALAEKVSDYWLIHAAPVTYVRVWLRRFHWLSIGWTHSNQQRSNDACCILRGSLAQRQTCHALA
jgi:hypothetical protein